MFLATCQENATAEEWHGYVNRVGTGKNTRKSFFVGWSHKSLQDKLHDGVILGKNVKNKVVWALPKSLPTWFYFVQRLLQCKHCKHDFRVCYTRHYFVQDVSHQNCATCCAFNFGFVANSQGFYFYFCLDLVIVFFCFFWQVIIRGSHIIVSRLSIDVDVQILTNPSLSSGQLSKARYQVLWRSVAYNKKI